MFEAKGERSQREILVQIVGEAEPGTLLDYQDLALSLGLDRSERRAVQSAVNGAKRSIEKSARKALVAVKNEGYRVCHPEDHVGLATYHQRKGRRQLVRAKSKVDHVNMGALDQGQRAAVIAAQVVLAAQMDFERRADLRYAKRAEMEEFLRENTRDRQRTEEQLGALRDRLSRLEQKIA